MRAGRHRFPPAPRCAPRESAPAPGAVRPRQQSRSARETPPRSPGPRRTGRARRQRAHRVVPNPRAPPLRIRPSAAALLPSSPALPPRHGRQPQSPRLKAGSSRSAECRLLPQGSFGGRPLPPRARERWPPPTRAGRRARCRALQAPWQSRRRARAAGSDRVCRRTAEDPLFRECGKGDRIPRHLTRFLPVTYRQN